MDTIIFYTEFDKVIGCTRPNNIEGEPFCDVCRNKWNLCAFKGQCKNDIQQQIQNERQLKTTFIKLYLEKKINIF
ncbi:MAG: hypothetical protein ACFFD2_04040 [Promethearchaeota archaeon]